VRRPPAAAVTSVDDAVGVRRRITLGVLVANFGAAVLLLVLLVFLVPQPDDETGEAVAWFVVVTATSLPGGALLGRWLFRPVERWLAADRPPTPAEEARAVGGPRLVALLTFGFWAAAAASVGAAEALDGGPAMGGVRDGLAILAGGLMSTALIYLLVEQQTRPLVRAVLAGRAPHRQRSLGLRPRLLLAWVLGSGVPFAAILVGELSVGEADSRISADAAVFLTGLGLLSGAATTIAAVRSVADPIAGVRRALGVVQRGDLGVAVPVDDAGEIGQLQAGVNEMVTGLRERQRLADLFGRHVGPDVARRAVEDGVRLGGERRDATALFVDLRDSTALAARATPEEVVATLNRFFAEVVRGVSAEGGGSTSSRATAPCASSARPSSRPTTPPGRCARLAPSSSDSGRPVSVRPSASPRARWSPGTSAPRSATSTR
jgi:adenylate cyclase